MKRIRTNLQFRHDIGLRLRNNLHAKLQRAARKNGVSLNEEMVTRLQNSFYQPSLDKLLERVQKQATCLGG